MNPDAVLLMDTALPWAAELPDVYTIYRSYGLFPDNLSLPTTPDECFARGVDKGMALAYLVKSAGVKAVMSLNERQPGNQYDAERIGAFEAGVASVIVPRGLDHIAFNWSVGYHHADRVAVAWAELRRRCLAAGVDISRIILGYHGYTATGQDAGVDWMENRTEIFYRAEFNNQGIPWPEWGLTECGYDNGVPGRNGWRHNLSEADYAAYLKRLPSLTPKAKFRTIFAFGCTQDWADLGFDILGDAVVLDAITETNAAATTPPVGGDTPMPMKNFGGLFVSDAESGSFDAWIAAAGGAPKVVYDQFRLWYAAMPGNPATKDDLDRALEKIGSGSTEAKLIASKLPFTP